MRLGGDGVGFGCNCLGVFSGKLVDWFVGVRVINGVIKFISVLLSIFVC